MNKVVFISGETSTKDSTRELGELLSGMGLKSKQVNGSYKGIPEKSFMVQIEHDYQLGQVKTLAKVFNQESILRVNDNHGILEYIAENKREHIGKLKKIDILTGVDAYSVIDGQAYTFSK